MVIVDLFVWIVMTISSMLWVILGPVLEYLNMGFLMVLEMMGVEQWTNLNTVISLLVIMGLFNAYVSAKGRSNSGSQMFSGIISQAQLFLWMFGFLSFSADSAIYPQVALLSLAFQFAGMCITVLFSEFNNYSTENKTNVMDGAAAGVKKCLELESFLMLIVAVFGFPSFTEQDNLAQYYCLVPMVAIMMTYHLQVRPNCDSDSVDHVNGDAVPVKETEVAAPAPIPAPAADETVLEQDIKPKENAENVSDEVVPEAAAETADGSTVETIADAEPKTEAMIKRLQTCVTGLISKILSLISPITNLITKIISTITGLPWTCITMTLSDKLSYILLTMAWLTLTSNTLAYTIPVFSLVIPFLLTHIKQVPSNLKPYIMQVNLLSLSVVQFCLISGVGVEAAES